MYGNVDYAYDTVAFILYMYFFIMCIWEFIFFYSKMHLGRYEWDLFINLFLYSFDGMDFFMLDAQNMGLHTSKPAATSWAYNAWFSFSHIQGVDFDSMDKPVAFSTYNEYSDYELLLNESSFRVVGSGSVWKIIDIGLDFYCILYVFVLSFIELLIVPLCVILDYLYDIYLLDSVIIYTKIYKILIFYILGIIFYKKSIINSYKIRCYNFKLMRDIQNKGNTYLYYIYMYLSKKK